ncbi:bifunctional aspartate transaminase/aspartate 4-decarboxylase [Ruegeria sp. Ofav3-42]|uniref:bifunctional aspartate transaminase/aspartate 4-decarboxylase n=1 Tax=Ruegeria sp. Ofav3-42 TaxID=2917759 RepID=UPI001EF46A87|nr:bifunctional aspartate transaminase/aspartate 4-decarboxylase [Ruegeria sp. Ofav3-42]MCG7521812.1 bifunctional aspartate transaminase/aspartate 4-decarboxylase [Ruegeria sp. Ofav3-42]
MSETLNLHKFENLSPFQIKDELIKLAKKESRATTLPYLNAGRGNPNWIATKAREAFFLLGQFAMTEAQRDRYEAQVGLAGMPQGPGCYDRLKAYCAASEEQTTPPGAETLIAAVDFAIQKFKFDPDAFVLELTDGIVGDHYPMPDRCLVHNETIVHEYLMWAMCAGNRPKAKFDLFPVEGGTAAMCYIFKSLKNQRLLNAGDTIALGTPIFTPYLEMPVLEDYSLNVVDVSSKEEEHFQLTDEDLETLAEPKVKALFLVNPGNPSAVAISPEALKRLVDFVKTRRPDLIILTDDVYGTFVPNFESVMGHLPENTIGVYSYSKYFGCTGWRLGTIVIAQNNIFDKMIAEAPAETKALVEARYETLSPNPAEMKFIDRIVADSRDVALNHTAGLSLPQQVMMTLFSLVEMMDEDKAYQAFCRSILDHRFTELVEGLGIEVPDNPYFDKYYGIIDFEFWLRKYVGQEVVEWIKENVHPLDISFKLAQDHGIVLLNGSGFDAPNWSARVSFANLDDSAYRQIGRAVRSVAIGYVQAYRASKGMPIHG